MKKFWNWVKNEAGRTLYDITPKKFKNELGSIDKVYGTVRIAGNIIWGKPVQTRAIKK